jgi:hypothetical protein
MLVMANTFNIAADLAAMGEALSLVIGGLNREHALIFAATSVLLQVFVRYRRYAPALKFLTLALFLYVATAFTIHIPWGEASARSLAGCRGQPRLSAHGRRGARDDHQSLPVLLASIPGGGGDEAESATAPYKGTPPSKGAVA